MYREKGDKSVVLLSGIVTQLENLSKHSASVLLSMQLSFEMDVARSTGFVEASRDVSDYGNESDEVVCSLEPAY